MNKNKVLQNGVSLIFIGCILSPFLISMSCSIKSISHDNLTNNNESSPSFNGTNIFVNFDSSGYEEPTRVFFADSTCIVICDNRGIPINLIASIEFDFNKALTQNNMKVSELRTVLLRRPFSEEKRKTFYQLPEWAGAFHSAEYFRLEDLNIDSFDLLQNSGIRHLVLDHVRLNHKNLIIDEIDKLSNLQYLVYDFFTKSDIINIKKKRPNLIIMKVAEYDAKTDSGELKIF